MEVLSRPKTAFVAAALGLAALGSTASASPMEDPSLGGAVFTGPTQGHASSFFVNPAALGLSGSGWHIHFGASARLSSLYIDRKIIDGNGQLAPGDSVSNHTISPGGIAAWYLSLREDRARFGLSLFTPSFERFPEGDPAIGYHSEGGQLVQGMLTMAGSYRFGSRLILGLGFSLGYSALRLKFARDSAIATGSAGLESDCDGSRCDYENPEARESYDVDVGSQRALQELFALKNISASVGAAIRLPGKSWLGIGYVALPGAFGTLSLSGQASITGAPRDGGETQEVSAEISYRMAQMFFIGYRRPVLPAFDFVTDLRWQDWSRHNQFDIRLFGGNLGDEIPEWMPRHRGMKDVWRLSAGLESNDQQDFRYGARLRLETGAVDDDALTPMQVSGGHATLATGTELRLVDHWVFSLGYELSWFPSTDSTDSSFDPRDQVACVDSGFEFDSCGAAREGRALSTAAGSYAHLQHGMVLSLRYDSL